MKTLITTVGTSLFTNYLKPDARDRINDYCDIGDSFDAIEDKSAAEFIYSQLEDDIKDIEDTIKTRWFKLDEEPNHDASAEIKSILKIQELGDIQVRLLASDSVLSMLAAKLIKAWFEQNKPSISIIFEEKNDVIENLSVKDLSVKGDSATIESGFIHLTDKIFSIIKDDKNDKESDGCMLNISGGYKATIPFLTLIGQLEKIPLYYIYEDSDSLVNIANFPLNFDWDLAEQFYPIFLKGALEKEINNELIKELEDRKLIIKSDNAYKKTALGGLLKTYTEQNRPTANSVTGYFAEYKMFEYFINFPYEYGSVKYSRVEKSENFVINGKKLEIDLVLSPVDPGSSSHILCEVKIYAQCMKKEGIEKITETALSQITHYEIKKQKVVLYMLAVHLGKYDDIGSLHESLNEIKTGIDKKVPCKIFYFQRSSNYETFAKRILKKSDLKEWQPQQEI